MMMMTMIVIVIVIMITMPMILGQLPSPHLFCTRSSPYPPLIYSNTTPSLFSPPSPSSLIDLAPKELHAA
jgi:hypothetical protein